MTATTWEEAAHLALVSIDLVNDIYAWGETQEQFADIVDQFLTEKGYYNSVARFAYRGYLLAHGDRDIPDVGHQLVGLLASKQHDYGHDNILRFGVEGVKVRISDKVCRLKNLLGRGAAAANEAIEDSWLDIIGYCVIAIMLENGTFELPLAADVKTTERMIRVHDGRRSSWRLHRRCRPRLLDGRSPPRLRRRGVRHHQVGGHARGQVRVGQVTMVVSRHISTAECPWLDADIPEGTEVFRYYGYTYGCISPNGVPVTLTPDKTPFLEVPRDAVGWIHE